jgi:hypothetical protein
MREKPNQKPAANPSELSPEPPVQETTPAEMDINGRFDEYAKTGVTVGRQSIMLKVKTTVGLAAATLINHTREKAEAILLQEMWETPGHNMLNYNIVVTDTNLSVDTVMMLGCYYFQATNDDNHTRVTINVALGTNASISNTSKQEYVQLMTNNALSDLRLLAEDMATNALSNQRLHAENIKDASISMKDSTPMKRDQMGSPIAPDTPPRMYKPDNVDMNTGDLANTEGSDEDAKLKERNVADKAKTRGPNDNAKYKQLERQLTQRWLEETHSQSLACELMAVAVNCPATSARQFKRSNIRTILMNALDTENFANCPLT